MDVLARTHELTIDAGMPAQRAPWQTRFSRLPTVPPLGGDRRVSPIAIPVIGGRPIDGRHLVRAPWAEPLAAFAGVIVETQLVPDAWIAPRSAARRVMDPPLAAVRSSGLPAATVVSAPALARRPMVAIPIVPERGPVPFRVTPRRAPTPVGVMAATGPAHVSASTHVSAPAAASATGPAHVSAPTHVSAPAEVSAPVHVFAPTLPPALVMSALGRPHRSVPATAAAPIEPFVPSPVPTVAAPARRGLLGRAVVLAAGLVMSLVAVEAAARLGRR